MVILNNIEAYIKDQAVINISMMPPKDEMYSGVCLKATSEVFIFINYEPELGRFDGYTILRGDEVGDCSLWEPDDVEKIPNNNLEKYLDKLPLPEFNSFSSCLAGSKSRELISVYTRKNKDAFYMGKLVSVDKGLVELKLIDHRGKWVHNEKFKIDDIDYIGFESHFEKDILKNRK